MKDKLTKHHLPKSYFVRKKIIIIFFIAIGLGLSVALPVGISIYNQSQISQTNRQG